MKIKVVEVRRRSERVITVVMVLEEEVLRIIMCVWSTEWQNGCRERTFL